MIVPASIVTEPLMPVPMATMALGQCGELKSSVSLMLPSSLNRTMCPLEARSGIESCRSCRRTGAVGWGKPVSRGETAREGEGFGAGAIEGVLIGQELAAARAARAHLSQVDVKPDAPGLPDRRVTSSSEASSGR